jgi:hypothetical protein
MTRLLSFFDFEAEPIDTFGTWRKLVNGVPVLGRRAHDARLVAAFAMAGCDRLLTLDPLDFSGLIGPANLTLVPLES